MRCLQTDSEIMEFLVISQNNRYIPELSRNHLGIMKFLVTSRNYEIYSYIPESSVYSELLNFQIHHGIIPEL